MGLAASSPLVTSFGNGDLLMLANDPVTQARIDLTTALRAAARHGLNEGVCKHFSMTVAGREDLFLVNPQGLHRSELTAPPVAQTYGDLYSLERAAMVQVLAMQTGKPLHNIDAALAEHTANQIAGDESKQALLHFESLKRMLDRDEPGWRRLSAHE